jgi:Peptidase A4 family
MFVAAAVLGLGWITVGVEAVVIVAMFALYSLATPIIQRWGRSATGEELVGQIVHQCRRQGCCALVTGGLVVTTRRSLALFMVIGLSCLVAACGGSDAGPHATTFSRAGYQALSAYLRFSVKLSREEGSKGLPAARINRLRPVCRHLGPNSVDIEVRGVQSWCTGELAQAAALYEFRACTKLVGRVGGRCDLTAFRRFEHATLEVVAAQNGVLQILGTGPCYKMMDAGVPSNRRLLGATDQLGSALSYQYVPHKYVTQWQQALSMNLATAPDLSAQVRHSTACQPGSRAAASTTNAETHTEKKQVRTPTGGQNQGCACVGYLWRGDVTSVSASWTVPRLTKDEPRGIAGTWIGAESPGRFIQIGVNEGRDAPNTDADLRFLVKGLKQPLLYGFWSDTAHHFHPVPLPRVKAGDVVSVSLELLDGRWQLEFSDPRASVDVKLSTPDEATGSADDAEWLQEDVQTTYGANRLLPYPKLSPITFTGLKANGVTPVASQLLYRRRPFRSAKALVATPIHNDGFTVFPTTLAPAKAQYIAKADSVCEATDAKIAAAQKATAPADASGSPSSSKIVRALRKIDALGNASLPKLRAIPKPVGSGAVLNETWDALAKKFHVNAELIPAVETHSKAKLTRASAALSTVTSKYESLAQRYGFNACGQS